MKKPVRIILKTVLWCAIIGGLGYGGYRFYQSRQAATASTTVSYTKVQVTTGNLAKSVTGTGTLSISETKDVSVAFPVTVTNVYVEAGEQVKTGDPLVDVDKDALTTSISDLETELSTTESSMTQLANSYDDSASLKASASARIKAIYAVKGDLVQDVMDKHNALMLLSMDGKMKVTIPSTELAVGDEVMVIHNNTKYDGTVQSVANGAATITFSDAKALEGDKVDVAKNSVIIGSGTASINLPFYYTSTSQGRISSINYAVNAKISRNSTLFSLTQVPMSSEYDTLVNQKNQILTKIKAAKAVLAAGKIVSPIDGIVSSVITASDTAQVADAVLTTLYVGDAKQMVVSVDELDIINVKLDQEVSIAMDAVTDKTYSAKVSHISQIGTTSSGVTTYSVTLSIDGDDQLKIGMNGTATIQVDDVSNVLLVPITSLNTSKDGQYVWLYTDTPADGEPGIKTFVTTGLSSDTYAEVKSGLKAGDYVMVTRSASSESGTNNQMMSFGVEMPIGGGEMPSGGQMPGGTGTGTGTGTGQTNWRNRTNTQSGGQTSGGQQPSN